MKNTRREFIKLAGIGFAGTAAALPSLANEKTLDHDSALLYQPSNQRFNMSGYRAPKLDTVRVGVIGLGMRGPGHAKRLSRIEGVSVKALCDIRPEKAEAVKEAIKEFGQTPDLYTGDKNAWKLLCDRPDIDLIIIATPWANHVPMAIYAMEHGKHVGIEVPASNTIEEAWELVEVSEKTKKHCMMLENCCYDYFELLTLNMARQGFFGDIVHCEGAYIHSLLELNFQKTSYYDMWRLKENIGRNGNLYPTHGLGPVCQVMNINRGDKMDYLVSVSTNDFMMAGEAKKLAETDDFYKQFVGKSYRGNMNTTTIKTNLGRTIMLQHDVTSPRPYSRIHLVSGTKGTALKYPLPGRISNDHNSWLDEKEMKAVEAKYQPAIVSKIGEMAKQIGGHGGMDFLMLWRLVDCLRNGLPLDQDVYDAALWSSINGLSEKSVAKRAFIDVPDFTAGNWKSNKPVDLTLDGGGNTKVKALL